MKRSPLKRTPFRRRRKSTPELDAARKVVLERAAGRCECCAWAGALEVHHVQKRSQGGRHHPDNCIALCHRCHAQTDFAFLSGRLVITPLGGGRFQGAIVFGKDKWGVM